ncbi:MAG: D-alanyl-D-alanine carboxypeptidase, partial [Proteobacteria bacterium]|nr:D-alanyl-D-alanine carboxypeptidase [Pseudomonadota bacterium]
NSSRAVPPASTQKSFTALSVLLARGPDARLRTEVAATTAPVAGVLPGSLWLVGGGDPYLTTGQLRTLAADVRAALGYAGGLLAGGPPAAVTLFPAGEIVPADRRPLPYRPGAAMLIGPCRYSIAG